MQARINESSANANATFLAAACAGDKSAWDEIIRRYEGAVRAAVACYRPTPDAADVIQNTWLRLFEHAATIRDPERLGGWLMTTARRECLAQIRRQRSERPLATIETGQPCPEATPEAMVILTETRQQVRLATEALPTRYRALVEALYYRPCGSYTEVARHTGMPIGSIGPTRLRAMRCLRHRLSDLRS